LIGATEDQDALRIYQDLLDRIGASYITRDFDAFRRMIHIPHTLSSYGPKIRIDTTQDLRRMFDDICSKLKEQNIDTYMRICIAAAFEDQTTIIGAHETRLMNRAQVVEHAYPVKSVLRRFGDDWMVCESDNAIDARNSLGRIMKKIATDRGGPAGSNEE
jgi:hypothetical protein